MDLRKKGIAPELVEELLDEDAAETTGGLLEDGALARGEAELTAAETFAKKKRLGPWRRAPLPDDRNERAKA